MAVVMCHPHPQFGGTMHNKVVFHAAKAFNSLGWPVLRFNFRGVGESTGTYGGGVDELEDARAALEFLVNGAGDRVPPPPALVMAGFSFGSVVGLQVGAQDGRVGGLCGIGVPVLGNEGSLEVVVQSRTPKLFVQGSLDEYGPLDALRPWFERVAEPKRLEVVEGAGHFFENRIDEMKAAITRYFGRFGSA